MMDVWDAIRGKRSIRVFTDEPLPDDVKARILDAGRRSPSGRNTQPWRFIVITDKDMLEKVSHIGRSTKHVIGAAMCVLILSPIETEQFWRDMFDIGQAAAFMQLTAHELGVGSCPGTVYEPDLARELLGFPAEWKPYVLLSFGYPDYDNLPEGKGKGGRLAFDEVVHYERWTG